MPYFELVEQSSLPYAHGPQSIDCGLDDAQCSAFTEHRISLAGVKSEARV